ncbi:MAG: hypothetical protein KA198_01945 [Chitinophagaceae bacterium]|nr:hypothetical protein [Chitinophagaceae bacterium]
MKRILFILVFMTSYVFTTKAQLFSIPHWDYYYDIKAHEKGQLHFSYGYGQPRLDKELFKYHKAEIDFRVVGIGPFMWKAEYGLTRKLSVALSASYILYKSDWKRMKFDAYKGIDLPFTYGTQFHDLSANLRFNYHLFVNKDLDVYIGGGAGYNYFKHKDFTAYLPEDTTFNAQFKQPFPVSAEMTFGIRYYFLTRTAIYLEAGYAKSIVQAGFVFKFRHRKRG